MGARNRPAAARALATAEIEFIRVSVFFSGLALCDPRPYTCLNRARGHVGRSLSDPAQGNRVCRTIVWLYGETRSGSPVGHAAMSGDAAGPSVRHTAACDHPLGYAGRSRGSSRLSRGRIRQPCSETGPVRSGFRCCLLERGRKPATLAPLQLGCISSRDYKCSLSPPANPTYLNSHQALACPQQHPDDQPERSAALS